MSETTDPVLDALRTAAPVQDADLNTSAVRDVIALMAVRPRRRYPARIAVAAAATVAIAGAGIWFAGSSPDDPVGNTQVELVAAHFDAVAKQYPLPKGQSYEALRTEVVADAKAGDQFKVGTGRMPKDDGKAVDALVARYSGCKWWQIERDGTFDKLSPDEQAEVQRRNQKALAEVLKVTDNPNLIPLTDLWDELCKDVE